MTAALAVVVTAAAPGASADAVTSAYVSLPTPTRLLDTRDNVGVLPAGGIVTVNVTGVAPLPTPGTTVAAVLNVTIVGPAGVGFWTAYPHAGRSRPACTSTSERR